VNVVCGVPTQRKFMSGYYTVSSVTCKDCQTELGWKYIKADLKKNRFKERKLVLEKPKIKKEINKSLRDKKKEEKKDKEKEKENYACFSGLFMSKGQ